MALPFSQACENNKQVILSVLKRHFTSTGKVIEIASGTGQHAEYFAQHLPHLRWQSTDILSGVEYLDQRLAAAKLNNLPPAKDFNVTQTLFQHDAVDYVFSANSLHIMPASAVTHFFRHIKTLLKIDGVLCVYGPFKYAGEFTTPSNADFDLWLKHNNSLSGVRDFETVCTLAGDAGLELVEDNPLPANNQLLVWKKVR